MTVSDSRTISRMIVLISLLYRVYISCGTAIKGLSSPDERVVVRTRTQEDPPGARFLEPHVPFPLDKLLRSTQRTFHAELPDHVQCTSADGPFCFQQMQAGIHKPSAALDAVETDPYEGKSTVFAIKAVKDFDNVLSLRTTLVEFFHPDPAVCPQCKEALIELEMAAKELRHSGVTVVKVNCAEAAEICDEQGADTRELPDVRLFMGSKSASAKFVQEEDSEEDVPWAASSLVSFVTDSRMHSIIRMVSKLAEVTGVSSLQDSLQDAEAIWMDLDELEEIEEATATFKTDLEDISKQLSALGFTPPVRPREPEAVPPAVLATPQAQIMAASEDEDEYLDDDEDDDEDDEDDEDDAEERELLVAKNEMERLLEKFLANSEQLSAHSSVLAARDAAAAQQPEGGQDAANMGREGAATAAQQLERGLTAVDMGREEGVTAAQRPEGGLRPVDMGREGEVDAAQRPEGGLTAVDMGKPKWDVEELAEEVPTEGRAEAAEARTGKGKEAAAQASSRPDARSRSALRRAVEDQMLSGIDKVDGVVSKATDMSRVIEFVNNSPRSISLFWVDFRGTEKEYIKLKPQEKQRLSTYVSHVWVRAYDTWAEKSQQYACMRLYWALVVDSHVMGC
ncbi:hypothetical protein CYMTET_48090 [Cymbomonas tetramitiformis]|uniref:Thioredoxin domain-containing protein n=1 Tax=Cymbomonas tetramitiformis TaxID=36881 RepID=A0AAE0BT03_9CHLO|nr:hypothetical protein CYMTET_48090 [Cymbomonas tetramitiformis]